MSLSAYTEALKGTGEKKKKHEKANQKETWKLNGSKLFPLSRWLCEGAAQDPHTYHHLSPASLRTLAQAVKNKYLQLVNIPCFWALRTWRTTFLLYRLLLATLDLGDPPHLTLNDLVLCELKPVRNILPSL